MVVLALAIFPGFEDERIQASSNPPDGAVLLGDIRALV